MVSRRIWLLMVFTGLLSCTHDAGRDMDVADIIGQHRIIFTNPPKKIPVPYSVDAPLLGNGYTGIALSGEPEKQVYYIARNDFWRLKSSYNHSFPAVLGRLEITVPGLKGASYLVEQDLFEACTRSTFALDDAVVTVKSYVSATEDLMVVELEYQGMGELQARISLALPDSTQLIDNPPGDLVFPAVTEKGQTQEGIHFISRAFVEDVDMPTKAACAFRVMEGSGDQFILTSKKPLTIAVAFSSNFKHEDCEQHVVEKLRQIDKDHLESLASDHKGWWAGFWGQSYVNINEPEIEKLYYQSNYTLACFSRDRDFPPSIFGTCVTKERPAWNGDYHLNYNHLAPYYGLFSSNHVEQAIPCNMPILAFQNRGEYYSVKICGINKGIMLPVGIGPLGIETTRRNEMMEQQRSHWINDGSVEDEGLFFGQKSNSAYCVVNMANHFYTTYDEEYTQKYYPFVAGVATFWENYLILEDGRYMIYNDAIHEGTIGTVNPILSLGLVRLVFQTAIDMSKELECDFDRREKWQYLLDHMSGYTFQEREGKKVFRYSERGTDWWRDNTLGIQHIYPGGQIGLDSDKELLDIAHNTIDVMHRWIDFNGSNSFFPAAVRVGYNADTIFRMLHKYVENTYPNGFQLNNPHGIENCSTVPNTINLMLCTGYGNKLRVFPVWPLHQDAAFRNLRTEGAFLVSSALKKGIVEFVEIFSEKGKTCNLVNPWPGKTILVVRENGRDELLQANVLTLITRTEEHILVKPQQQNIFSF